MHSIIGKKVEEYANAMQRPLLPMNTAELPLIIASLKVLITALGQLDNVSAEIGEQLFNLIRNDIQAIRFDMPKGMYEQMMKEEKHETDS